MTQSSGLSWHPALAPHRVVWRDLLSGFASVMKSLLALVGVMTLSAFVFAFSRPEIRASVIEFGDGLKIALFGQETVPIDVDEIAAPAFVKSETAGGGKSAAISTVARLPADQRAATDYLARKYRLAPDAIAVFVAEAFRTGQELKLDPLLLLAVMSIESSMNPFAQSPVGAQGLMQIMPSVHADRFAEFGGPHAALHPDANIRVGAEILKEYVQRFGSVEDGLRAYVGSGLQDTDNGYGARVLGERARLESIVKRVGNAPPAMRPVVAPARSALDARKPKA